MSEENRDYVKGAYECFIKNAEGLDPTDPVKAVEVYFEKNATDELKARCKAEGKTAAMCWGFIEAVARRVGGSCHIDPGAVYAMAMHYFEDVPVDWKGGEAKGEDVGEDVGEGVGEGVGEEIADKPKKPKAKAKDRAKKPKSKQGFFFELLDAPDEEGGAQ